MTRLVMNGTESIPAAAAHMERHTLRRMSCRLAWLLYLSTTRNLNTGRFEHFGLESEFGAEASDAALRQLRDANYRELALLSIRELREEIGQYCESVGQPLSLVRKAWTDSPAELLVAPRSCDPLPLEAGSAWSLTQQPLEEPFLEPRTRPEAIRNHL